MTIKSLELRNYRNYEHVSIDLENKINIFYGKNAQGKTNILESVYLTATTKSHRGSKDREIININSEDSHIRTLIEKENREYRIDIHLKKNKSKGIAINGVPVKKAADIFGILRVIFFSPEDLNIIKNGPAERRRFLDIELCQIDKIYLSDLTKYNKALSQRNKLLKDLNKTNSSKETLEVWTNQLIYYGKKIIEKRENFIKELESIVSKNYKKISGGKEELTIKYEPCATINNYEKLMEEAYFKDERFAQTSIGPHRDDISFDIGNMDARKFGSQGQQRSCALALKLSEIEIMYKKTGEYPVLLLDDVMSELDSDRQRYLLDSLYDVQTLITCTGMEDLIKSNIKIDRLFYVNNANVEINNQGEK